MADLCYKLKWLAKVESVVIGLFTDFSAVNLNTYSTQAYAWTIFWTYVTVVFVIVPKKI